jgi:hypothetical protein
LYSRTIGALAFTITAAIKGAIRLTCRLTVSFTIVTLFHADVNDSITTSCFCCAAGQTGIVVEIVPVVTDLARIGDSIAAPGQLTIGSALVCHRVIIAFGVIALLPSTFMQDAITTGRQPTTVCAGIGVIIIAIIALFPLHTARQRILIEVSIPAKASDTLIGHTVIALKLTADDLRLAVIAGIAGRIADTHLVNTTQSQQGQRKYKKVSHQINPPARAARTETPATPKPR